ncbi:MAG TPA: inositol monophosphatase family protein [Anaerolineae bacterium]|nr:inositol monophosphatase family protein [Anaerolineae bacterium]HNT06085.1 inositol monophosphatase family protein [Anaerolineae bacterium]
MDPIEVAIDAARLAGAHALRRFRTPMAKRLKGPADLVTEADSEAEELIVRSIRRAFPDHAFLGEEGHQPRPEAEYTWVIDPIDGTRNYVRGIPFFCTSLALTRRGVPVVAVIFDPVHQETFHAQQGRGAYLNGTPVRVNREAALQDGVLALSLVSERYRHNGHVALPMLGQLQPMVESVRLMGSAALHLAYLACGRCELVFQDSVHPWDILAGALLVQEAGGVATELQGTPVSISSHDIIAASNRAIHDMGRAVAQKAIVARGDRRSGPAW